ncbi:MAG: hypothetical protein ACREI3_13110 [Nitrospirales bacterium]
MKMILIQNACEGSYAIWSHNLSPEQAAKEAQELQARQISAQVVDQGNPHEVEEAEICGECQKEMNRYLARQQSSFARRMDPLEGFEG